MVTKSISKKPKSEWSAIQMQNLVDFLEGRTPHGGIAPDFKEEPIIVDGKKHIGALINISPTGERKCKHG